MHNTRFAGDLVVAAGLEKSTNHVLEVLETTPEWYKLLKINTTNRNNVIGDTKKEDGAVIEQVQKFSHVENTMTKNNLCLTKIERRVDTNDHLSTKY